MFFYYSNLIIIFESRYFNQNKIEKYTLSGVYFETLGFDFKFADKYLVINIEIKNYKSISKKER